MPGWNFAAVWEQVAAEVPDRVALVCGETRRTWREFEARSARLASHLSGLGVSAGESLAIDLTNRIEYLEAFFAALRLGARPANVNYRYLADEVHYVLADAGARVCVHGPAVGAVVADAAARLPADARPTLL
ncbi:MAG TPA: AMP-binding protein, partial [Acidimicrobiia bacterium]